MVGTPSQVLNGRWDEELAVALPTLTEMAERLDSVFSAGRASVSVITRRAVALATIPVVVRHHPDTTKTGNLGGMALSGPLGWWPSRLGATLSPSNVILVGPRDIDAPEQEHIDAGTITLIRGGPISLQELDAAVGNRPVYFHLDCDVLDPGIVPTDFQVPGGLSLSDLHRLAQVLARRQVIGVEIAEFETPQPRPTPVQLIQR